MPRLPIESCSSTRVVINGRELIAFGGCNYLGLADRPSVRQALIDGLSKWGFSTTASRETTGNTLAHESLERELSAFVGQESAILTAEGYTANFACMQGLARDLGVALIDQRAHRSIRDAAVAAGMQVFEYEHLNAKSAKWLIDLHKDAGVTIITDSVFAADGSIAPLPELLALLPAQRSALVVDDCHGLGVLGDNGQGAIRHFNLDDPRIIITSTLAKGLGCYGGVVMGKAPFIRQVREKAWVYRSSTPVPPPIAEAARAAVSLLRTDPTPIANLHRNCSLVRDGLSRMNLPVPEVGVPIFTFALPTVERMRSVYDRMLALGVLTPLIDYPGGPTPLYFRIVVNACHSVEQIERLLSSLREAMGLTSARLSVVEVGERALA